MSKSTEAVRGNLSRAGYEAVVALGTSPVPSMGFSVYSVETSQGNTNTSNLSLFYMSLLKQSKALNHQEHCHQLKLNQQSYKMTLVESLNVAFKL